MYAVIVRVTIAPGQEGKALEVLKKKVVPTVKKAPGFVSGTWLEPIDGKAFSITLYKTEDQARAAAPAIGPSPFDDSVTIISVVVRGVAADAKASR